jgi:hypothetical protein
VNLLKAPQEKADREAGGNTAGILTALLLFVCIISFAYYTWYKSVNPSATPGELFQALTGMGAREVRNAQLQFEFEFDSKESPVFAVYGDYIAKCSNTGIRFLDKKGGTIWSENMTLNKPVLKSNGPQLLVADIGSSDLYVVDGRTIRWKDRLDTSILNADISQDGYVTVIVASKRYNNEIRVYDPYGVELFRKIIANDFAVNAGIAPTERTLAVSGINTGSYGAYSEYKFYDFQEGEPTVQTFEESGELLPLFWFNGDGSLFAAGDASAAGLDGSGKLLWEKRFTAVMGACPAGDKKLAVVEESSDGVQLKLFDAGGQEAASCGLSYKPDGLAAIKGAIAAFSDDTVYFYNDRGNAFSKYSPGSKIRQVLFFNKQTAAVISGETVKVVNTNG